MKFVIIILLFTLICACYTNERIDKTEDYYWRDYRGSIPSDALPGGRDADGRLTYIAQVLYEKLLVPGEIRDGKAYFEYGFQQFATTENVKILCTRHATKFQWVITTKEDFKTLTDKNFILGGYEPNNRMYIGRKSIGDALIVGKVQVILPSLEAVFHYPKDGKGYFDYSFEILTYL